MKLLEGRTLAQKIRLELSERITSEGLSPGLSIILVGDDPASATYVRMKKKAAEAIGITFELHTLKKDTSQAEIIDLISSLNNNPKVHGILIQLPLPTHLNTASIVDHVCPSKDVDGFTTTSSGLLVNGTPTFVPGTTKGIMKLCSHYKIKLERKNVTIIGRSRIVGKPLAHLMLQANATVTICHSKTNDISKHTKNADIIVLACGQEKILTADMINDNAIVIDVGTNRNSEGKLVGDADTSVHSKASSISPVPGGVGPMTIAMLLENVVEACERTAHVRDNS